MKGVRPHLSRTAPPPAGAPPGFRGLTIAAAALHLPDEFDLSLSPDRLTFEGLTIGPDGLSGQVRGGWEPVAAYDETKKRFDEMAPGLCSGSRSRFALSEIDLKQNLPVAFTLAEDLALPFFDQPIGVDIHIGADGALEVLLSATQPPGVAGQEGLATFRRPDVLEMTLQQLRFAASDGGLLATLTGTITPLIGGLDWPAIEVRELTIDREGNIRIDGGWLDLPDQVQRRLPRLSVRGDPTRAGPGR